MNARGVLASILFIGWLGIAPAAAPGCCHHGYHCDDCDTYYGPYPDDYYHHGSGYGRWSASGTTADLQTAEGKITEIDIFPEPRPTAGWWRFTCKLPDAPNWFAWLLSGT